MKKPNKYLERWNLKTNTEVNKIKELNNSEEEIKLDEEESSEEFIEII